MKKVIIIGAGIAGLTCGIYARQSGFDTEIYEMHTIPGGECTGWDRKGYHFDGCIHWLIGTKEGTSLNKMWRETGALGDSVNIINHDVFCVYEEGEKSVKFYTDTDKLEKHFLEIAPEDKKQIKKLIKSMRNMGNMGMPIDKPMDMMTAGDGIKYAARNLGAIMEVSKYGKLTMRELAEGFANPMLRRAMLAVFSGGYNTMAFVSTLAGMNAGDCGCPEGGSRALAARMEKKYLGLGGKVYYKSMVEKVLVESGSAVGIKLKDGKEITGDYIISCADGYATLKSLLGDRYTPEVYDKLYGNPDKYLTPTCSIVFLGAGANVEGPRMTVVRRKEPISISGVNSDFVSMLNYSYEKSFAPEGNTVMACYYEADYDFWKALSSDEDKYKAEKKKLEQDAIAAVISGYPETEGKIEVTDVVTPLTYEKYCNAWRGSWMSWVGVTGEAPQYFSGALPGLENFIMAGMWTLPPGGLLGAAVSGRFAAQRLCMQNGMEFKTKQ